MAPTATSPGSTTAGPVVRADAVTFRFADPHRRLTEVRLAVDLPLPDGATALTYRRGAWRLTLARPPVDRLEYAFEVAGPDGRRSTVTDPANERTAPGAFGAKSVVEFPGYRAPAWLTAPRAAGRSVELAVASRALGATVRGSVWTPDDLAPDEPAPLLVVHDGPEFASLGGMLDWAAAMVAAATVPPLRVALLAPGDRNRWYAADPAYARALTAEVVPALAAPAPATMRIAVGASLGALAALHAHRHRPGTFDALFLQSGSFFRPDTDAKERRFSRFRSVTRFVRDVEQAVTDPAPVPTAMTCGRAEENVANNRPMATALRRLGYPVSFAEVADLHNFTAWRDALDPHLTGLVQEATA